MYESSRQNSTVFVTFKTRVQIKIENFSISSSVFNDVEPANSVDSYDRLSTSPIIVTPPDTNGTGTPGKFKYFVKFITSCFFDYVNRPTSLKVMSSKIQLSF